jgi:hypothetical protein
MQQVLPAAVTDGINERVDEALGAAAAAAAEHVLPRALVVGQEFDNFQLTVLDKCHAPLTRAPRGRPAKKKRRNAGEMPGRPKKGHALEDYRTFS